MPELPEVESARRLASQACTGLRVNDVKLFEQGGGPRNGLFDDIVIGESKSIDDIKSVFIGKRVNSVNRKGKQLWFDLSGSAVSVLFHFGMTGAFVLKGGMIPTYRSFQVSSEWPPKFTKMEIIMENDVRLGLCDPRRLARVKLRSNPLESPPISLLAPDPFLDGVSIPYFRSELLKYNTPIKSALLDQEKIFCGIGNWIADEVLYQSKIHPNTPCKNIAQSKEHVELLANKLTSVISLAVDLNANNDIFPDDWLFHYRWNKKKSSMPNGSIIFIIFFY